MKLTKLSEKILKYMVSEYYKTNIDHFKFDKLKSKFPTYSDDFISKAIYLLKNEEFVNVISADNVAYLTILLPTGIQHIDHNTFFKKIINWLKEVKNLIH